MFTQVHYGSRRLNYLSLDILLSRVFRVQSVGLFACPSVRPSLLPSAISSSQPLYVSINPLVCMSVQPFIGLSADLSVCLSV